MQVCYSERWPYELQRLCNSYGITSGFARGVTGREFKVESYNGIAQLTEIPDVADFPVTVWKD